MNRWGGSHLIVRVHYSCDTAVERNTTMICTTQTKKTRFAKINIWSAYIRHQHHKQSTQRALKICTILHSSVYSMDFIKKKQLSDFRIRLFEFLNMGIECSFLCCKRLRILRSDMVPGLRLFYGFVLNVLHNYLECDFALAISDVPFCCDVPLC